MDLVRQVIASTYYVHPFPELIVTSDLVPLESILRD